MCRALVFIISLLAASPSAVAHDTWRSDEDVSRMSLSCTSKPAYYENMSAEADGFVKRIPLANDVIPSGGEVVVMANKKLEVDIDKTIIELGKQKSAVSFYKDLLNAHSLGMSSKQEQLNSKYELGLAQLDVNKYEHELRWLNEQKDSLRLNAEREIVIDTPFVQRGDYVERGTPLVRFFSKDSIIYTCFIDKDWHDIFTEDNNISAYDSDTGKYYALEAYETSKIYSNSAYQVRFNATGSVPVGISKQLSMSLGGAPVVRLKLSDKNKDNLWIESADGSRTSVDIDDLTILRSKGYLYLSPPKGKVIVASKKAED